MALVVKNPLQSIELQSQTQLKRLRTHVHTSPCQKILTWGSGSPTAQRGRGHIAEPPALQAFPLKNLAESAVPNESRARDQALTRGTQSQ